MADTNDDHGDTPVDIGADTHAPVIVIGSGPAGYTAAIYAARAGLRPVLIAGLQRGGQLTITTEVENYPGYADPVQGPWMMEQMHAQAENVGARLVDDIVTHVDLDATPRTVTTDSGTVWTADAIVIATGAQAKWLNLPSEQAFMGFGVSACATCDGFFYRQKRVAVIGGGNTAVEEALYLSGLAAHVTLVHRRGELRAERILVDRLMAKSNIEVRWHRQVDEILGRAGIPPAVTGLRLEDPRDGSTEEIEVDGVFVAIGHAPATELFKDRLRLRPSGYLWTAPDSTATDVPGVFAAGDVTDDIYRQAVTAAGMGCMAALEAERWLAAREAEREMANERAPMSEAAE